LALFFTYPFERAVFGPLVLLVGTVTFFSPPAGLGLFLLSTLTTLQLPILLDLPFFSGPEPGFLAMAAAVALRNLIRPRALGLTGTLAALLLVHVGAVLASSVLLWTSFWDLPGGWTATLTGDALAKIYFWRWGNPFNFPRMALLLIEGVGVFLVALHAFRCDPRSTLRYMVSAFAVLGILLAAYSTVELLFRGKEISWYPGFGPVFADRNAYAAFWVILAPFGLALALRSKGPAQALGFLLVGVSWLFCALSLSITGIAGIVLSSGIFLILRRRGGMSRVRVATALALGTAVVIPAIWHLSRDTTFSRVFEARVEERISFWAPAAAMIADQPLLGIGPGEFYRRLPEYRARLADLPASAFTRENVHNYYLQLAAGTGLVGALSFILLAGYLLWAGGRRLPNRLPDDLEIPRPKDRPGLPDWFRLSGADYLALLLASLAGLLILSVAQHPMLRFPFQAYYWIFAALIVGLSLRPRPGSLGGRFTLLPAGALLLASVGQALFFPLPPLGAFQYGFHQSEEEPEVLLTEGVAFLRTEWDRGTVDFELRAAPGSPGQSVEIHLNGERSGLEVREDQWSVYRADVGGARMMDLGIRSRPVQPHPFPDGWGAGVQLRGLPVTGLD
jgi:hypothetical protein